MIVLGINAFHPDSSAAIIIDGKIECAIEEERLTRIKHWAGYPALSVGACLDELNLDISDVDFITINRHPKAHLADKVLFTLKNRPSLKNVLSRIKNRKKVQSIAHLISNQFGLNEQEIENKIMPVEHHHAHLASTFFTSPFEESVILSIDGFGDFVSTMWGLGNGKDIKVDDYVGFPNSLGLLYSSITQYLGFWNYGDEYKVMGMAAYGRPTKEEQIMKLISTDDNGKFALNTKFFLHSSEGVSMEFDGGYPKIGQTFSKELIKLLGPSRSKEEAIDQRHKDIACSTQAVYEKILFHVLKHLNQRYPGVDKICLAGGCAQNSLANGKITSNSSFKDVWIQPAAGDAGGAIGSALHFSNMTQRKERYKMIHASLGQSFNNEHIEEVLKNNEISTFRHNFYENEVELLNHITTNLIEGKVIGFYHGRSEWGPRALGNRSIIVDPRIGNMKELLNKKIKKRESFRPFAPSILKEEINNWFEKNEDVPFMTHVFKIREEKRSLIPAVTHQDGTGRLQSVEKSFNKRYYNLIKLFFDKTSIPMILNTSFNENEPIVNNPQEALSCFLRTNMDVIVLENHIITR